MTTIKDFKNRVYVVLEITKTHTIAECALTLDRITISNNHFLNLGYRPC